MSRRVRRADPSFDYRKTSQPAVNFFFFNDTATTEIYTLSLHDALPIYRDPPTRDRGEIGPGLVLERGLEPVDLVPAARSEEHTSELQSPCNLVCRLLLEKKKYEDEPARGQSARLLRDDRLLRLLRRAHR